MATHMISFRIQHDTEHTDRWSSTIEAIRNEASDGVTWEETTSLILLKSSKSAEVLAMSIYVNSKFDVTKDKLLVVDATTGTYATRGQIDYPATLAGMFAKNSLSALFG